MSDIKKVKKAWYGIKWRCHCKTARDYHKYGARGIKVSVRWRRSFKLFLRDVGIPPSASHSLERIENNKGYIPGNVRWATPTEQTRNRRNTIFVEVFGEKLPLAAACEKFGLVYGRTIRAVKKGYTFLEILNGIEKINKEK